MSYFIARCGKTHTVAENVVCCVEDIVLYAFGDNRLKTIKEVPLLSSTVLRRIEDMISNVECVLVRWNEAIWVLMCKLMNLLTLLVLLLCLHFWFNCKPLPTLTLGESIFSLICDG
jgi:hypothetical protein